MASPKLAMKNIIDDVGDVVIGNLFLQPNQ
jgi:hypothetical protein